VRTCDRLSAAGRGHDDIDTARQHLHLRTDFQPAHDQRRGDTHVLGIAAQVFEDLCRQFARRRQDQRPAGLRRRPLVVGTDGMEDGQHECGRLAGARLGNTEHVAPFDEGRNRFALDRGRLVIAGIFKRAENGLGQAEFIELCQNISFMGPERCQRPRARTNGFSVWKPA
jgi:hypothetical protein